MTHESQSENELLSYRNNGNSICDSNIEGLNGEKISKYSEMLVTVNKENKDHRGISMNQLIPKTCDFRLSNNCSASANLNLNNTKDPLSLDLKKKGYNIGHLNIQGLCGDSLNKFSEISILLTSKENEKITHFWNERNKVKKTQIDRNV